MAPKRPTRNSSRSSGCGVVGNHLNNQRNGNDGTNDNNNNERNVEKGNDHDNLWNGNNNRDGNECTYKEFKAYGAIEFDGKGGALVYTRWVEKMESMIDISNYAAHQRVKYTACSLTGKVLTYWNTHIQARGRKMDAGMPLDDFKAFLMEEYIYALVLEIRGMVRETEPSTIQSAILRARALTDDAVKVGKLSKCGDKRKFRSESSKQVGTRADNKRARMGKGFLEANPTKREYTGSAPECAKCTYHHYPETPCHFCTTCNHF
nr:reverse transcriptase domain-containing protein [Tanacetum cinerariifolium]